MLAIFNAYGIARNAGIACGALLYLSISVGAVHAQSAPARPTLGQLTPVTPDPYHEFETKYLFGFTEGADIGAQGEQSVEFESTTEFGHRGGHYGTLEQEIEQAGVVTALGQTAWDTSGILSDTSLFGRVLHTLFGYADQPSIMQVVVYSVTLLTIFALTKAMAPRPPGLMADKSVAAG